MLNQSSSVPDPEDSRSTPDQSLGDMMDRLSQRRRGDAVDPDAYLAVPEVIQHLPKHPPRKPRSPGSSAGHSWLWLLLSFVSCVATSAAAVGALLWLINLPPSTNCDDPAQITTDRAALSCAQAAADDGNLEAALAGLALVQRWGPDHWLSHESLPLVDQWSAVVVAAAEQELRQGRRAEAEAWIGHIPPGSSWHRAGQDLLAGWNQEWEQGSALVIQAQTAMANQDWRTASAQMIALGELNHPHWREEQVQALSRQMQAEQQAHDRIRKAVNLASAGGTDRLLAAMDLVLPLTPDLLAYEVAQTYLDRWGDLLLAEGLQHWYSADLDQAIAVAEAVARHPSRAQVAQELIWLSQARHLARQSLDPWKVTPQQMTTLYRAMLLANRIPSDSPYHPQAQSSLGTWRTHLEGLGTLQLAQLPGGIHHMDTLKIAMRQAETIPPDHPRRMQAQTLLAHWRQALERMEDAPHLSQAHRWAKADTPAGLKQAIASASRITAHRALRSEAQSWIYVWTHRLHRLEDQPTLDRAYQLAEQGQFSQAVVAASTIRAGRPLYDEAAAAIARWQRTIAAQERIRYPDPPSLVDPRPPVPPATPTPPPRAVTPMRPSITTTDPPAPAAPPRPAAPPTPPPTSPSGLPRRIETVPGDALPPPVQSIDPPPRPLPPPVEVRSPAPPVLTVPPPVLPPSPPTPAAPIQTPPPSLPHGSDPEPRF